MGLLQFLGLVGTAAYGVHYAKNETKAIIGDSVIKPTHIDHDDKNLIEKNFKLICKRCDIKLDSDGDPIIEKGYNPCMAYLQYRGFKKSVTNHFKDIYIQKYRKKYNNKIRTMQYKHNDLLRLYIDHMNEKQTKVFRYWHWGDTEAKCKEMMKNMLWSSIVDDYNVVKDGSQKVEVWIISAPPSILKQVDTLHDEVWFLENNTMLNE